MRRGKIFLICAAALGMVSLSHAAGPIYGYQSENFSFGFEMTHQPIFPPALRSAGVHSGEATFLLQIDGEGQLNDYLAVEATHREFIEAVEQVVEDWRYLPTMSNGEPSIVLMKLRVSFHNENDLVVLDSIGSMSAGLASMAAGGSSVRLFHVKELDDFLVPIHQEPVPFIPYLQEGADPVKFTMEFFVDKRGRVRMPRVLYDGQEVGDEWIIAAQESLLKWKFEPPRVRGRPVVVEAAQPFVFLPPDS